MVPPPTRGWSRIGAGVSGPGEGSPAHAGMVPRLARWRWSCRWFPRPRGDGPRSHRRTTRFRSVPPPTRGWSPGACANSVRRSGSPAHAGMVPAPHGFTVTDTRFPRPRGDGPRKVTVSATRKGVPPPTRGWSRAPSSTPCAGCGSPAHAGMVPSPTRALLISTWFPRPRGDGPGMKHGVPWMPVVPPPTRGWSPTPSAAADTPQGSPAHAGMVPRIVRVLLHDQRFPRPRGDGPIKIQVNGRAISVPPPWRRSRRCCSASCGLVTISRLTV